jgi:signal transduction histidine kinase
MWLRPTLLDDLGLLPALVWHLERYTAHTGVAVAFEHRDVEGRRLQPAEVETSAYRIVQEALTNVAQHARVREAVVRIWLDGQRLCLQIEDQGAGFDPGAVFSTAANGLSGMQERAILLGGRLTVEARPEAGTRVTVELPVRAV